VTEESVLSYGVTDFLPSYEVMVLDISLVESHIRSGHYNESIPADPWFEYHTSASKIKSKCLCLAVPVAARSMAWMFVVSVVCCQVEVSATD
jgi:hypothetical protein